ncbi:unnamed protein product [Microthlaspi erraticum]|uniref:Uncharacterized protein n=1 Tax=Microthlaspi erraticum TaxID=1685480 RepID=A0A6D2IB70_9BRAS|nr:unnamed protein product [Microthlaspi erraticum]CAA7027219.1 unnamed protein product [Microthlaspi erraticum]
MAMEEEYGQITEQGVEKSATTENTSPLEKLPLSKFAAYRTMSQLLIRLSKICHRNNAGLLRSFSSSSPYLTLGPNIKEDLGDGRGIGEVLFFDPAKEELVTVSDKVIPDELHPYSLLGSAQGWGFFSSDRSLWMSDLYHPSASKSNPKMIPLPPLTTLPFSQTELAKNVAVSCEEEEEEGFVAAIKFLGTRICLLVQLESVLLTERPLLLLA